MELWTDGTVQEDQQSGKVAGAGAAHLYLKDARNPYFKSSRAAGFLASSYTAEGVGIRVGVQQLAAFDFSTLDPEPTLLVCSDSLSLLDRLSQGPLAQDTLLTSDIWKHCVSLVRPGCFGRIAFQHVPSHCGLKRNEAVDRYVDSEFDRLLASQAQALTPIATIKAALKSQARAHFQDSAKQAISTSVTTGYRSEAFPKKNPVPWSKLNINNSLPRADETLLTQLRCGWCTSIGPLWHRMNPSADNPNKLCRWCAHTPETITHLFSDCSANRIVTIKHQLKLKNSKSLGSHKVEELQKCVQFARQALSALQDP